MHKQIDIENYEYKLTDIDKLRKSYLPLHSGVIYCYTNKQNQKCYIGQTIDPMARHTAHICSSKLNSKRKDACHPFHLAIRKYGINSFSYSVIAFVVSDNKMELHQCLNDIEDSKIAEYQSHKLKYGYNIIHKSNNGWAIHPNNTPIDQYSRFGDFMATYDSVQQAKLLTGCKNISNAIRYKTYYANGFVFVKHGEQVHDNIFQRFKNMVIHQYSIDGDYIKSFNTLRDAAKEVCGDKSRIQLCAKSGKHVAYGYRWNHTKYSKLPMAQIQLNQPVYQYDQHGNFVSEYPNLQLAAKAINKKYATHISACIKDLWRIAGGYYWRTYKTDKIHLEKRKNNYNRKEWQV